MLCYARWNPSAAPSPLSPTTPRKAAASPEDTERSNDPASADLRIDLGGGAGTPTRKFAREGGRGGWEALRRRRAEQQCKRCSFVDTGSGGNVRQSIAMVAQCKRASFIEGCGGVDQRRSIAAADGPSKSMSPPRLSVAAARCLLEKRWSLYEGAHEDAFDGISPEQSAACTRMLCCAMLCYAMRCDAMLCYAMPCHAMPCHAMLCYAML
jgi:hypothetical protein